MSNCERNCDCAICQIELLETQSINIQEEIADYQIKVMDIFEKFVKSGIGS